MAKRNIVGRTIVAVRPLLKEEIGAMFGEEEVIDSVRRGKAYMALSLDDSSEIIAAADNGDTPAELFHYHDEEFHRITRAEGRVFIDEETKSANPFPGTCLFDDADTEPANPFPGTCLD